jgi:hypothetical protein
MFLKKGIRALGIAESFYKEKGRSVLVGLVQRADGIIDGFSYSYTELGGLDSTEKILEIYQDLGREDINYILISGVVISYYNVIDLHKIHLETGKPVISLTYEETEGIINYLIEKFPRDWEYRLLLHLKNGVRIPVKLKNGFNIYMRPIGITKNEALEVVNRFILEGKYPEPIRIARLIANKIAKKSI